MGASRGRRLAGRAVRKRRRVGQAWRAFGETLGAPLDGWQIECLMRVYGDAVPVTMRGKGKR